MCFQVALMDSSGHHEVVDRSNKNENQSVSHSQMTAELEASRYKIELDQTKQMYIEIQVSWSFPENTWLTVFSDSIYMLFIIIKPFQRYSSR